MSEQRRAIRKKSMWVIAMMVVLAIATVAVVELFATPPLEVRVEEVMKSHGFKVTMSRPTVGGDRLMTDFRAEGLSRVRLEQLALELKGLAAAKTLPLDQFDSGFSLSFDPEGGDDDLVVSVVPYNEVDGEWETIKAVMLSNGSRTDSPWQWILDLWPF